MNNTNPEIYLSVNLLGTEVTDTQTSQQFGTLEEAVKYCHQLCSKKYSLTFRDAINQGLLSTEPSWLRGYAVNIQVQPDTED